MSYHSVLEIQTDDDARILFQGKTFGEINIIIRGGTLECVKRKVLEILDSLKIESSNFHYEKEIKEYLNLIKSIIEDKDKNDYFLDRGGNRTVSWYIDKGSYNNNEIIIDV